MTALDAAIEAAQQAAASVFQQGFTIREAITAAVNAAVNSGYLILADDREALLAALGAEQVGMHGTFLAHAGLHDKDGRCGMGPEPYVPVYKVQP